MKTGKLEYLKKKYEEKLNPAQNADAPMPSGRGRGMGRPGRGAAMGGRKPKNAGATVGRLFGYIAHEKWKLFIVLLFVVGGTAANLAGSYMLRPIINGLTSDGGSVSKLLQGISVMAAIYVVITETTNQISVGL